jgi:hypothetical protein
MGMEVSGRVVKIGGSVYLEEDNFDSAIKQHQTQIEEFEQQIVSLKERVDTLKRGKVEEHIFGTPSVYDKYWEGVRLQQDIEERRKKYAPQQKEEKETDIDKARKAVEELKYIWAEVLRCHDYAKRHGAGGDFGDYNGGFTWLDGNVIRSFFPSTGISHIHPESVVNSLSHFNHTLDTMRAYIERIHKFHHDTLAAQSTRLYLCPCGKTTCRGFASEGKTKCGIKIGWKVDYLNHVTLDDKEVQGQMFFDQKAELCNDHKPLYVWDPKKGPDQAAAPWW